MSDRQKLDKLFDAVAALRYHTIRCRCCEGKENWLGSKRHLAWLVDQIEGLYDCLDEPAGALE